MRAAPAFVAATLVALLVPLGAGTARADAFQTHTYQADLPHRLVERPLVVGKGWVQFRVGLDWKDSTTYFTGDSDEVWNAGVSEGEDFQSYSNDARWTYRTFRLDVDWGFTKNSQVFIHIPFVWAHLGNANGADVTAAGVGDVRLGLKNQWYRRVDPKGKFNTSLASTLEVKTPTGNESPGSYLSSPGNFAYIPLGTGTYDLSLDFAARQQAGPVALDARVGYTLKFSGVVQYLIEDDQNQFNLRVDPGDEVHLDVGVLGQLGPYVGVSGSLINTWRFRTRQGPSSDGIDPCSTCEPIEGSDGLWTDVRAGVVVAPNRNFQVDGFVEYTLAGRNSTFYWPLEDISPSRGLTAGGGLTYRF